jgi:hypothetical protein
MSAAGVEAVLAIIGAVVVVRFLWELGCFCLLAWHMRNGE